jgi:hypothetical protein
LRWLALVVLCWVSCKSGYKPYKCTATSDCKPFGAEFVCASGECQRGCVGDNDCAASAPFCVASACVTCGEPSEATDAGATMSSLCKTHTTSTPFCNEAGACVQCVVDADCGGSSFIGCENGTCISCHAGTDCATGACTAAGACATADEIFYVDNLRCPATAADGSAAKPFCQINDAIAQQSRGYIVVAASNTPYNPFAIVKGAIKNWSVFGTVITNSAVSFTGATGDAIVDFAPDDTGAAYSLTLEQLFIAPATDPPGGHVGFGVRCKPSNTQSRQLTLRSVEVIGENIALEIDGCNINASQGSAIAYQTTVEIKTAGAHSFNHFFLASQNTTSNTLLSLTAGNVSVVDSAYLGTNVAVDVANATLTMDRMRFHDMTGAAIVAEAGANVTVTNSAFFNTATSATSTHPHTLEITGDAHASFLFDTFYENGSQSAPIAPFYTTNATQQPAFTACLFEGNALSATAPQTIFQGAFTFDHIVVQANEQKLTSATSGVTLANAIINIDVNDVPNLLNALVNEADVACCIDKYTPADALNVPSLDCYYNTKRPQGSAWDIGSYELFQP